MLVCEKLSAKLDYWKALKTKLAMISDLGKLTGHLSVFEEMKQSIESHISGFEFNAQLPEMKDYTITTAIGLAKNPEFLKLLGDKCNEYLQTATAKHTGVRWGFSLIYEPQPVVVGRAVVDEDLGNFQIKGSLLFGEYWDFL